MDRRVYNSPVAQGDYYEVSTSTPGFHRKVKLGEPLPNKFYEWKRFDCESPYGPSYNGPVTELEARGFQRFSEACDAGYVTSSAGDVRMPIQSVHNLVDIVQNQLLSKIRDQDIDLGVALGEARETASFITNAMVKTAKSYKALRRGNVSLALRILTGSKNDSWRDIPGVASNTWLAYTYGLRPLLQDVYGALEALDKRNKPLVPIYTVRSGTRQDVMTEVWFAKPKYYRRASGTITVSGCIEFSVNNPLLKILDSVGLVNPLSIAWELVPFSFVVDWFLPVGQVIQNVVPPQGVDFQSGWVSFKCRGGMLSTTHIPYFIPNALPDWSTSARSLETWKRRSPLSSFPSYHLVVPDFSLSKSQVASGLALLWQVSQGSAKRG